MNIIIAPAKKMNAQEDCFPHETLPEFLEQTQEILTTLQGYEPQALQALWKCNDKLAQENIQRVSQMNLRQNLVPALFAYEGLQYRHLSAHVLEQAPLDYLSQHLSILSGFYGRLRPLDGVTPYRLEMQAKLPLGGHKHLYDYWGDRLARSLERDSELLLDLASKEYSKAVVPHLSSKTQYLRCSFVEEKKGNYVETGSHCKMARGEMLRWMAIHSLDKFQDLQEFQSLDYRFQPNLSHEGHYVFLKQVPKDTEEELWD